MSLALVLAATAGPGVAHAASASLRGNYSGVYLISQGSATRVYANALIAVTGSNKAPKIVITPVSDVAHTQSIKLAGGHIAQLSAILPGQATFAQPVKGTFKGTKNFTISGSFAKTDPAGAASPGKIKMTIGTTNFGSTLIINSTITFDNGGDPVYATIIALK